MRRPSSLCSCPGPTIRQSGTGTWRVTSICFANILFTIFNNLLICQAEPPVADGAEWFRSLRDGAMKCGERPRRHRASRQCRELRSARNSVRSRILNRRYQPNGGGDYAANPLASPLTGADPDRAKASPQTANSGSTCGPTSSFKKEPRPSACPAERLACREMREGVPAIPAVSPSPNSCIP
jgi:hypothetical protein